jgi:hypothetical protein
MKTFKTAVFIICIFISYFGYSNPTVPPPIITEVYFDENDEWTLEFIIDEFYFSWYANLDSLRINTALLEDEILIEFNVIYLITADMLIGDLEISRSSGSLHIETWDGNGWSQLDWGTNWNGPPTLQGQSWAVQQYWDYGFEYSDYYVCHNYPPTLGGSINTAFGYGTVHGNIYDLNQTPIPGVEFTCDPYNYPIYHLFYSNDSGYFTDDFLSKYQYIHYEFEDPFFEGYFYLWVEIDSVYTFEIIAPVYLTGIEKNKAETIRIIPYPNPTKDIVHFQISIPKNTNFGFSELIICDCSGEIIDRLEAGQSTISWQPPASGVYYSYLVMDNQKTTPSKFIVTR